MGYENYLVVDPVGDLEQLVGQGNVQIDLMARPPLVGTVHGADGGGQHQHPGFPQETGQLIRFGIGRNVTLGVLILLTGQHAQFTLHGNTQRMGHIHHLPGVADIILQRHADFIHLVGGVIGHHAGEGGNRRLYHPAALLADIIAVV